MRTGNNYTSPIDDDDLETDLPEQREPAILSHARLSAQSFDEDLSQDLDADPDDPIPLDIMFR